MIGLVMDYPESAIFLSIALFCLVQSWLLKRDFFSPANVFCFSQSITLGIAYMQLTPTMSELHFNTWLALIGGGISFMGGCFCLRLVWKQKQLPANDVGPVPVYDYRWKLHFSLTCFLFLVYVASFYGIIKVAGNLLLLTGNPADWMGKEINYGYYPYLFMSGPLVVMLYGVSSFKSLNPHKALRICSAIMCFIAIALNVIAYPNRSALFFSIASIIIFWNFLRRKIPAVLIMITLALAVVAFVAVSTLREQYGSNSVESYALEYVVELPYKYVANNYWNLDYGLNPGVDNELHPYTYGIDAFFGMFELLRVSGALRTSYGWDGPFNESIEKEHGFNTVSYLWDLHKDFGWPGMFILPFICGFMVSFLYNLMRTSYKPRNVIFYVFFVYFVGWWFFTSAYKQGIYWIWALLMFCVTTLCNAKQLIPDNTDNQSDNQQKANIQ